jgi:hypothetical protein
VREFDHRCSDGDSEEVAATRHGPDHLLRVISQGTPDFTQTLRQRIIRNGRIRPHCVNQFLFAHQAAVVFHEIGQNLERFGRQSNLVATSSQEATIQVQGKVAEAV